MWHSMTFHLSWHTVTDDLWNASKFVSESHCLEARESSADAQIQLLSSVNREWVQLVWFRQILTRSMNFPKGTLDLLQTDLFIFVWYLRRDQGWEVRTIDNVEPRIGLFADTNDFKGDIFTFSVAI